MRTCLAPFGLCEKCAILVRVWRYVVATRQIHDPVLARFRAALDDLYGDQIERVVLFGSRARGDARPDSDYDVAVFLRDMPDRFAELYRLADLAWQTLSPKATLRRVRWYPIRQCGGRVDLPPSGPSLVLAPA
jgi:predicted nucleotidyltransferase